MTAPTLAQLLAVEDDPAVLEYRCPASSLPIWPLIRTVFLRMAISDFVYATPLDGSVSRGVSTYRAAATLARSLVHDAALLIRGQQRATVCVMSSGAGHQLHDGRLLNRLSDHFALAPDADAITVEEHFYWRWPFPRHNERVLLQAPWQVVNSIAERLSVRSQHRELASQLIEFMVSRSQRLLGWQPGPRRESKLIAMLASKVAGIPMQVRTYGTLLDAVQPRLLMLLCGCYGPSAALIAAARQRGIVTAEYQHGTVSGGHDAYNFGEALRASPAFRATLPDYFLGFGAWWIEQINAPLVKLAIGNPSRQFWLEKRRSLQSAPRYDILVLSDGTEIGKYLDLASALAPLASPLGLRVRLRPHPLERGNPDIAKWLLQKSGIEIDMGDDLYASLGAAQVVVSELSTALFEAAGLADRVFIWDTPKSRLGFPEFPFETFTGAHDLCSMLADPLAGRLTRERVEAIWAADWREGYRRFLSTCGIAKSRAAGVVHA